VIVALFEEHMVPGRRVELILAHDRAGELLRGQRGFVSGRLLAFAGGGYLYRYEMDFSQREDWDRFFASVAFPRLRAVIDPWLVVPFGIQIYAVRGTPIHQAEPA
jgi:hypothetical protein